MTPSREPGSPPPSTSRLARRREVRSIIAYLKSDLYERDRDYSHQAGSPSFTCDVAPVEVAHDREMLWGSPLGWRVLIGSTPDDAVYLKVYKRDGNLFAELPPYTDHGWDVGVNWLDAGNLP